MGERVDFGEFVGIRHHDHGAARWIGRTKEDAFSVDALEHGPANAVRGVAGRGDDGLRGAGFSDLFQRSGRSRIDYAEHPAELFALRGDEGVPLRASGRFAPALVAVGGDARGFAIEPAIDPGNHAAREVAGLRECGGAGQ